MDDVKFSNVGRAMANIITHKDAQIKQEVCEYLQSITGATNSLIAGHTEVNNFSVCFSVVSKLDDEGWYVKVPRTDLFLNPDKTINNLTDADFQMGAEEYKSLKKLNQLWPDTYLCSYVRCLGYDERHNAIITRKIHGIDLFKPLRRKCIFRKLLKSRDRDTMAESFKRLGMSLSEFHAHSATEEQCDVAGCLEKISYYLQRIGESNHGTLVGSKIESVLHSLSRKHVNTITTDTLKGFDLRNVVLCKHNQMYLLDPGKLKRDCREADLARFLVTCSLLYWGSFWFFLGFGIDTTYEKEFLTGYDSTSKHNPVLLSLFKLKELLKQWDIALLVLKLKKWPNLVNVFIKSWYINKFYRMSILNEIKRLHEYGLHG